MNRRSWKKLVCFFFPRLVLFLYMHVHTVRILWRTKFDFCFIFFTYDTRFQNYCWLPLSLLALLACLLLFMYCFLVTAAAVVVAGKFKRRIMCIIISDAVHLYHIPIPGIILYQCILWVRPCFQKSSAPIGVYIHHKRTESHFRVCLWGRPKPWHILLFTGHRRSK